MNFKKSFHADQMAVVGNQLLHTESNTYFTSTTETRTNANNVVSEVTFVTNG